MEHQRKVSRRGRVGEGRPSKRSPEVTARIAEAISNGLSDEEAATVAGIHPDTLLEWKRDEEFSGAIKKACCLRLERRLARIEEGAAGWQAVAWILERLHGTRFARPEVAVQATQTVQVGSPEFRISVERAEDLTRRSAALESEAESLLSQRQPAASDATARNRLQGLL